MKGSKGFKDATTCASRIRDLWTQTPDANVAIATGAVSGVFVVDADLYKDENCLSLLENRSGPLGATYTVMTPRGGRHFYFQQPPEGRVGSGEGKLGRFLDVKGDGGYVVAPPSIFEGAQYKRVNGTAPAVPPSWLWALVSAQRDRGTEGTEVVAPSLCSSVSPSLCLSVQQAVEAALPDGPHMNHRHLFKLARGCIGMDLANHKAAFAQWFETVRAQGLLKDGAGRDDYFAEFMAAVGRAKTPLGQGIVEAAWKLAGSEPLPAEAELFETPGAKKVVALCYQLDRLAGRQEWYLPCRTLAVLADIPFAAAATRLRAFVSLGVLRVVRPHTTTEGIRYRYAAKQTRK
jgi:hypothetical protein